MFKTIRRLTEACECLTSSIEALRDMVANHQHFLAGQPNVEARVDELERERALFESEVHGELLKAKTEYQKAASAEQRAKTAAKNAPEPFEDAGDSPQEFRERYDAWLQSDDGAASAIEAVQILPEDVGAAATIVETLRARKRGGG